MNYYQQVPPNEQLLVAVLALLCCGFIVSLIIWKSTPKERKGEALFLICIAILTVFGNITFLAT